MGWQGQWRFNACFFHYDIAVQSWVSEFLCRNQLFKTILELESRSYLSGRDTLKCQVKSAVNNVYCSNEILLRRFFFRNITPCTKQEVLDKFA